MPPSSTRSSRCSRRHIRKPGLAAAPPRWHAVHGAAKSGGGSMTSGVTDSRAVQKPLPAEIDVCGLTHRGRVRSENADHFLIASFHRAMQVHNSSIPSTAFPALSADSRGYVFLVADGVGAFAQAANGSARAIRSVAQYLVDTSE